MREEWRSNVISQPKSKEEVGYARCSGDEGEKLKKSSMEGIQTLTKRHK